MTAGELLKTARGRRGVSQRELARWAGVRQSAISRIEEDLASPTVAMLEELLSLVGEELVAEVRPRDPEANRAAIRRRLELTSDERLERGVAKSQAMIDEGRRLEEERG
jgi:transcriptional regulator with XRE-family HTH domain